MRVVLTVLILLVLATPAYSQTVIYQTYPGTTIRDYSAPSYVVDPNSDINSIIARGVVPQQPFDFNRSHQNSLINRNLELQNQLLQQQLDELRRR